ncbi:MAG TPA: hypothetical protein VG892_14520 [Terriglobales bacterium]|nr:hypothetical protein [Terriglobales bacterium]
MTMRSYVQVALLVMAATFAPAQVQSPSGTNAQPAGAAEPLEAIVPAPVKQPAAKTPATPATKEKPRQKAPKQQAENPAVAVARDLLERSYGMGSLLTPEARAKILPRQIQVAGMIDPDLAVKWAEDALQFAQELTPGADRAAIYGSAIPALVEKDPELALEIFQSLPPEDSPASSAGNAATPFSPVRRLFSAIVQKKGAEGIAMIRQQAQRLAQTSYYPYSAVMGSFNQLRSDDGTTREEIFSEALAAYSQSSRSAASDNDFALMIFQESPRTARPLVKAALNGLAVNLLARADQEDQAGSSTTTSATATTASSQGSADRLLLRLQPMMAKYDPELNQHILEARPSLARGGPSSSYPPPMRQPPGAGTGDSSRGVDALSASPNLQSYAQYSQARRNPSQAIASSQSLTDPLARTLTLVGAASGLAGKDRATATSALEEAVRAAADIKDPAQQLQAATAIASATGPIQSTSLLRSALESGFNAMETIQQSGADDDSRSTSNLQRLIRSGFQQDAPLALSFIEQVRAPELKAGLLIDAAQSALRGQRRGGPMNFPGPGGPPE